MERRMFTREFKLEAVKLIQERGLMMPLERARCNTLRSRGLKRRSFVCAR